MTKKWYGNGHTGCSGSSGYVVISGGCSSISYVWRHGHSQSQYI